MYESTVQFFLALSEEYKQEMQLLSTMTEKNCNAAIVVQSASEFFQWCLGGSAGGTVTLLSANANLIRTIGQDSWRMELDQAGPACCSLPCTFQLPRVFI